MNRPPPRQLGFGQRAREAMVRGATILARAVGATLGPGGRCVLIDDGFGRPIATKDGVTVCRWISLPDPQEDLGRCLLADAAVRVVEQVGDGTTTTVVIAERLLRECHQLISAGVDPARLAGEVRAAEKRVVAWLMELSEPIGAEDLVAVANAAAKSDSRVTLAVVEAFAHVGAAGTITLREGDTDRTVVQKNDGFRIDRGWLSPDFAFGATSLVLEDCWVLATPNWLINGQEILRPLQFADDTKGSLLVVATSCAEGALKTLLGNHRKGAIRCCAVQAPGFQDQQRGILEDLAIWTGGRVLDNAGDLGSDGLGFCARAEITRERLVLTGGVAPTGAVEARVRYLSDLRADPDCAEYDRDRYGRRLGNLQGKVAEIQVGASTGTEAREIKDRVEDAINSVRVAYQDGVLPGAGAALVRASIGCGNGTYGATALHRAIEEPCRLIAQNAGGEPGVTLARARQGCDLCPGIKDPTAVVLAALRAAVSTVCTLLLAETSVTFSESIRDKRPNT